MRADRIVAIVLLASALAGCGGGTAESAAARTAQAVGTEELTRQWGPDERPDPSAEPLQFLYWRVDRMFEREDLDADGMLTSEEFTGLPRNFKRIDANDDGILTKKEIIDDMTLTLRERGRIP